MAEFTEQNLKNEMEDLNISGSEHRTRVKKMRCRRRCHGNDTTEIARNQWRRMMMRQRSMWQGIPQFWGHPGMMSSQMGFSTPTMQFMGPQVGQGGRRCWNHHRHGAGTPARFHPGYLHMMAMRGGKLKSDYDKEPNNECHENAKPRRGCPPSGPTTPFMMMPWMMHRGPHFRKFMNQNCNDSQTEDKCKEQPNSGTTDCSKSDVETNKQDARCVERKRMREMRRMMVDYSGGFPPMFPGAMYPLPPWMWAPHNHQKKCRRHCKKNKKDDQEVTNSGDEEETGSSNDEMLPENGEEVTEVLMKDDNPEEEILGVSQKETNQSDSEGESQKENPKGKPHQHHRRHQNRRLMREMMMNGEFPPMWFMMSQQPWKGFHKMKENNASKKDIEEATEQKLD